MIYTTTYTKAEFLSAVKEGRIVAVGTHWTRNGWTGFRFFELRDNSLMQLFVENASYYSKTQHLYRCTAWGTNRVLEVFLAIGYALGCDFNEMHPQVSSIVNYRD